MTRPRRTLGLSLLRIGLGVALVHFYASSYEDRWLIWGPSGLGQYGDRGSQLGPFHFLSFYDLWTGPVAFELLFHSSLVAAVAFTVVGGRLLTGLNCLFLYSIHGRNPLVLDGGDNLLRLLLVLMLLTETDLHFSPRARRQLERWTRRITDGKPQLRGFAHNCGVLLIVFQVLVVYSVAILWKLDGEPWRNGTAMYYIANVEEFVFRPFPEFVVKNPYLITAVTYSVMIGQVAIVLLGLSRRHGAALFVIVVVLHGGIALSMGLVTFSVVMISAGGVLLRDADWLMLLGSISRRGPVEVAAPEGRSGPAVEGT